MVVGKTDSGLSGLRLSGGSKIEGQWAGFRFSMERRVTRTWRWVLYVGWEKEKKQGWLLIFDWSYQKVSFTESGKTGKEAGWGWARLSLRHLPIYPDEKVRRQRISRLFLDQNNAPNTFQKLTSFSSSFALEALQIILLSIYKLQNILFIFSDFKTNIYSLK